MIRIGHGYDVHRLVPGRRLVLAGVEFEHPTGLLGHSDADVVTHALIDALLGAMRASDIGSLFPDTDPAYEGANSIELLRDVAGIARDRGYQVLDCDCTIAAQAPRLAPARDEMRSNLAGALGVDVGSVGVKATTTEGLSFVGREEGICAWAVCLLDDGCKG